MMLAVITVAAKLEVAAAMAAAAAGMLATILVPVMAALADRKKS